MNLKRIALIFCLLSAAFATNSIAQIPGNPENFCRNGFFPRESADFRLADVIGKTGDRVYFYGDERDDCPAGKNCRLKSYLVPGNEVIVSRSLGDYSCVWYQPPAGYETVSWIPTDRLKFKEIRENTAGFLGEWYFYENTIAVATSKKRGFLQVQGNAFWQGFGDNIHIGEIEEEVAPKGRKILIGESDKGEYACRASLTLLGQYLIVADNLNCGGANVTFSGIYRRIKK